MLTYKLANNKRDYVFIREEIFMKEQGFENEFDEIDDVATHITFYLDDELIGCGRFFLEDGSYTIGRIAVLKQYRRLGYASKFIEAIEENILKIGGNTAKLHAQYYIKDMYLKLGYEICSEIEYDEGVEHIWMKKDLKR